MQQEHRTRAALEAALAQAQPSPADAGTLELIVRRPAIGKRDVLTLGHLDPLVGLIGDTWHQRGSSRTSDGAPHPDMQINIMNSRVIALIAGDRSRWALAGDQLYVDLDLSAANLPPGTRLTIGGAVLEVTGQPHTGCGKFAERFGVDAMKFVNSPAGRQLQLRGINARVVTPGAIRVGDTVRKVTEVAEGATEVAEATGSHGGTETRRRTEKDPNHNNHRHA
jgi:hypothetical protein